MSEDSTPDATPNSNAPAQPAGPDHAASDAAPKRGAMRQIILVVLLGLMLLALAYDYRVARPNVDRAYEQIAKLNDAMNSKPAAVPTLSSHIHKEIGRSPARSYTEGLYRVEVFSWTAGLPFRTHDLYAVYVPNGNDLIFMRHYKYQLPKNELDPPKSKPSGGEERIGAEEAAESSMGPGGGGGGRGGRGGDGPAEGGRAEGDAADGTGDEGQRGEGRPRRPASDEEEAPAATDAPQAADPGATPPPNPEADAPEADPAETGEEAAPVSEAPEA